MVAVVAGSSPVIHPSNFAPDLPVGGKVFSEGRTCIAGVSAALSVHCDRMTESQAAPAGPGVEVRVSFAVLYYAPDREKEAAW